jgi:hypothetical protein
MAELLDFVTVSPELRAEYNTTLPESGALDERLADINARIRALLMSMAGRNIPIVPFSVRICRGWNEVLHI